MLFGAKYILTVMMIITILGILYVFIFPKLSISREKYSTFECGMDLMNQLRLPFSLHFFFVSIIFLIFDVELMLIMPFIFCMKFQYSLFMMILVLILFLILIIGFLYEWWTGLLDWVI